MSETLEPLGVWYKLNQTPLRDIVRFKLTARLGYKHLFNEAELPQPVRTVILKVVRRTRLWRREKCEVARELIAHFTDGLEDGQSTEELIRKFGDEKQTAQLIRRARKRQRPLIWHAWRWTFWTLFSLPLIYASLAAYYWIGSPTISVDYLAQLNAQAAALPEDERAWPVYREALINFDLSSEANEDISQSLLDDIRPGDEDWPLLEAYLSDHAKSIAQLRQAAAMPGLGRECSFDISKEDWVLFNPKQKFSPQEASEAHQEEIYRELLVGVTLEHLQRLRTVARLLRADSLRAAKSNNSETALANIQAMLECSRHTRETPLLISHLISFAVRAMACKTTNDILTAYPDLFSDDQLRNLAHLLAATEKHSSLDLSGERMWFVDLVQRSFTDDGQGDGRLTYKGLKLMGGLRLPADSSLQGSESYVWTPGLMAMVASRKKTIETYDRILALAKEDMSRPLWRHPASLATQEFEELTRDSWNSDLHHLFVTQFCPAFGAMRKASEYDAARIEATLLGIALELYRREHGNYPQTLDALAPQYLPKLPIDRITGKPLRYALVEGQPIVYSVGVDRDDDGGHMPLSEEGRSRKQEYANWHTNADGSFPTEPNGDWVLWPPEPPRKSTED